jgi:hypothetical protein
MNADGGECHAEENEDQRISLHGPPEPQPSGSDQTVARVPLRKDAGWIRLCCAPRGRARRWPRPGEVAAPRICPGSSACFPGFHPTSAAREHGLRGRPSPRNDGTHLRSTRGLYPDSAPIRLRARGRSRTRVRGFGPCGPRSGRGTSGGQRFTIKNPLDPGG